MKCLVTGMTSRQANARSAERAMNFTGLLVRALEIEPNEVHWLEPDVTWTREFLDDYDQVLVGVSPLLSLSSNRAYGALNVISHLWSDGPLTLFMDAPDFKKISVNLKVLVTEPSALTKRFFSYRKGYTQACLPAKRDQLTQAVHLLNSGDWPTTLVPALPWQSRSSLVFKPAQSLVGSRDVTTLTLDTLIEPPTVSSSAKRRRWAAESTKSDWYRRLGLTWPVEALTGRAWANDAHTAKMLADSAATLIEPTRSGAFWTTRYRQSLLARAPVYSDWSETMALGDSWDMLPARMETLSDADLVWLAYAQLEEYMAQAPDEHELYDQLTSALTKR